LRRVNAGAAPEQPLKTEPIIARLNRADPATVALAIALIGALTIAGFLFFEHVLGYPPCPLCLEQRYPYYFSVPLAVLLWLGAGHGASNKVLMAGFIVIAGAMAWDAVLAVYHSGIEWKFWPGPADCTGPLNDISGGAGGLLNRLQDIHVVRCDQAAWRFLGISLAGWNVPVSLAMALLGVWGWRGVPHKQ
jgi:disulfide bond formation protein DsbB